jgi:Chalcone isomerase-like
LKGDDKTGRRCRRPHLVRRGLLLVLVGLFAMEPMPIISADHPSLPVAVSEMAPDLHPLGTGSHTLWGLPVYDASLWVVSNTWNPDEPHALEVRVLHAVTGNRLVNMGVNEMARLDVGDASKRKVWKSEMAQVFPNLMKGDRMVAFYAPNHRTYFYLNGVSKGAIDDPTFGPGFFSIWLDPRTANRALRKSLLNK